MGLNIHLFVLRHRVGSSSFLRADWRDSVIRGSGIPSRKGAGSLREPRHSAAPRISVAMNTHGTFRTGALFQTQPASLLPGGG